MYGGIFLSLDFGDFFTCAICKALFKVKIACSCCISLTKKVNALTTVIMDKLDDVEKIYMHVDH